MFIRLLLLVLFLCGCSCNPSGPRGTLRVGVDTKWYPLDFGLQTAYVNGFTEDLLIEMARYTGVHFEVISANWDSLMDGLDQGKYDAVLSSLPPYEFNQAKYDFSPNYLDLGPVLIFPIQAKRTDLTQMNGEMIGVIANDPSVLLLQKHPALLVRNYNSIPELLDAVVKGEVQAALLDRIPAVNYVGDLYAEELKIVGEPLTDKGLHLVSLKGRGKGFSKTLETFRKKKTLNALLKKWSLAAPT